MKTTKNTVAKPAVPFRDTNLCKKYLPYILAFLVPAVCLYVSYAFFNVWPFGKRSVLVLDLNGQYVYFYEALKRVFFGDGSIFYSWNRNISGEFMGIFGYYLASPFSIIPVLFPRAYLTEGLLAMQLAKVGASGLAFSFYLTKTGRSKRYASVIFATLYGLIAYNVVQIMNPMWVDGVVFLPLIIFGLERLVKKKKFIFFSLMLGLMFISNFYIGYMVGIFTFFYFLVFMISEDKFKDTKDSLKTCLRYIIGGALAVGLAALVILPVYKSLSLGKMEFSSATYEFNEKFPVMSFVAKLFPLTYDSVNVQGLPFVYCGILSLLLAPLFFVTKKISLRKKICALVILVISFLLMYVSVFDLLMHGGQWPNWLNYRYSFLFSFLFLTIAAQSFNEITTMELKSLFKVYGVWIALLILFNDKWTGFVSDVKTYWLIAILFTVYLAFCIFAKEKNTYRICIFCLVAIISGELIYNSVDSFEKIDKEVLYSTRASYTDWYDEFAPVVTEIKEKDSSFYRIEKTYHRTVNDSMALNNYGISHSSSLMNTDVLNFIKYMGYTSRGFESRYNGGTIVGDSLLGIKYVIVEWEDVGTEIKPKDKNHAFDSLYKDIFDNGYVLHVYENPYALPIAFYADSQLIETEFTDNVFENQNMLINNILGSSGDEYFKEATINERTLTNITEFDAIDQMRYVPIDSSMASSVDYNLKNTLSGEMYMYIPAKYQRNVVANFNGTPVSDYFAENNHVALALGKVEENSESTLKLILKEDDLYMCEPEFYILDEQLFADAVNQIKSNPSEVTKKNDNHLIIKTTAKEDGYIYTSIPYEKGWSVKVDGKKVDTVCISDSLLAIPISAGEHTIKMKFVSNGFTIGFLISITALAIILFLVFQPKLKQKDFVKAIDSKD